MNNHNVVIVAILIFATQMVVGHFQLLDTSEEIEMDHAAGLFSNE